MAVTGTELSPEISAKKVGWVCGGDQQGPEIDPKSQGLLLGRVPAGNTMSPLDTLFPAQD